jgi:hypothetical protein
MFLPLGSTRIRRFREKKNERGINGSFHWMTIAPLMVNIFIIFYLRSRLKRFRGVNGKLLPEMSKKIEIRKVLQINGDLNHRRGHMARCKGCHTCETKHKTESIEICAVVVNCRSVLGKKVGGCFAAWSRLRPNLFAADWKIFSSASPKICAT